MADSLTASGHRPRSRLRDHLTLTRPVPSAAAVQVLVAALAAPGAAAPATVVRGALAVLLATAAANVLGDLRDITADAVDKPNRPLPSGRITPRAAAASCAVCTVGALLAGAFAYCLRLKGTVLLGNLLAASALPYGAALFGALSPTALRCALLTTSYMLCFELLKTLRDQDADRVGGYGTLTVRFGARPTLVVLRSAACLCTAIALLPAGVALYLLLILSVLVPLQAVVWRPDLHRSPTAIRPAVRILTAAWIPGLCAVAVLL